MADSDDKQGQTDAAPTPPVALTLLGLVVTGCGPRPEEICGSALLGAPLFALTTWALLRGTVRLRHRLREGGWHHPKDGRGLPWLLLGHAAISLLAALQLPLMTSNSHDLYPLVWGCAASNHLVWALLIWRFGHVSPAQATALASLPALLPALGGALGAEALAEATIWQYFYGGFLGAVPAAVILLLCLEARLRRIT